MSYSRDDKTIMNVFNNSLLDNDFKRCIVPNSVFKKYDSRAYSIFTDSLPVLDDEIIIKNKKDLKQKELVSFMPLNFLYKNLDREEEQKKEVNENVQKN